MSKPISYLLSEFVDAFPTRLEQGVLYISIPYRTTAHLCCCRCNEEVKAPLSPAQWSLTYDGQAVSLHPSIGNWSLPCQSHYWIRGGKVHWSRKYSGWEIKNVRLNDARAETRAVVDAVVTKQLFHLNRAELEHVLSTFSTLERNEHRMYGKFRTRDLTLGAFDGLASSDMAVSFGSIHL